MGGVPWVPPLPWGENGVETLGSVVLESCRLMLDWVWEDGDLCTPLNCMWRVRAVPWNPCRSLMPGCEAMVGLPLQRGVGLQSLGAGELGWGGWTWQPHPCYVPVWVLGFCLSARTGNKPTHEDVSSGSLTQTVVVSAQLACWDKLWAVVVMLLGRWVSCPAETWGLLSSSSSLKGKHFGRGWSRSGVNRWSSKVHEEEEETRCWFFWCPGGKGRLSSRRGALLYCPERLHLGGCAHWNPTKCSALVVSHNEPAVKWISSNWSCAALQVMSFPPQETCSTWRLLQSSFVLGHQGCYWGSGWS